MSVLQWDSGLSEDTFNGLDRNIFLGVSHCHFALFTGVNQLNMRSNLMLEKPTIGKQDLQDVFR